MRLEAVAHAVPSQKVANEDIVAWVRQTNRERHGQRSLDRFEKRMLDFFDSSGTKTRYYRDRGETSGDLLKRASRQALSDSGLTAGDIDLVVYVGVGRGWMEPAMANYLHSELELVNATAFDLLDACASWLRALQVVRGLMVTGEYSNALIVNCECNRELLRLDVEDDHDLERRLASFTVGEAASATVVSAQTADDDFHFRFKTWGKQLDLCMIPFANIGEYMPDKNMITECTNQFVARSRELVKLAMRTALTTFREDAVLRQGTFDLILSHAIGRACWHVGRRLDLPMQHYFDIHPRFGNLVSASVPVGISLALEEEKLRRGDRVLAIVPSAGFTMGFASFTY